MWTLTGFGDEIDPELRVQLDTLESEGIQHLDLRGVWNTNVVRLSNEQVDRIRQTTKDRGFQVLTIGSPIGKIGITDDFEPHFADFQRAVEIAQRLETPYVRIFSFYIPEGGDPANHRDSVLDRLGQLVRAVDGTGVTLVHENERGIYGDLPARCLDLLSTIDSPLLRAVWDPANFVIDGVRPFTEGYSELRPYMAQLHVKDALLNTHEIVVAGEGDGQWPESLAALQADGFDGSASLEPHLALAGRSHGFSGPELFRTAIRAFTELLSKHGIAWN